ncbi:MAG: TolC family protein [Verrucomicrobiota bacterium]
MKSFNVLLVFILAAFSAAAQTDTNAIAAPVETNAPAAVSTTNEVAAPTNAMAIAAARSMSLEDCIQQALQHNFDVQISRYDPQIQLFTVRANYGGYDPTLNLSGNYTYSKDGALIQNNQIILPTTSDADTFGAGLSGLMPWGMTYNFGNGNLNNPGPASISETWGQKSAGPFTTNFDNTSSSVGVSLTQPLLKNFWIDQTRLNIRVSKNRLKYSEQGLRLQLNTSITAVENAYYELIYAQENVKVQQEALVLAQTQLDQDRQRMQIGTIAQLDVQQDESQVASAQANLIAAQYTLVNNQNTLKNLLTDKYATWHDTDIQPTETITNAPLQLFDLQDSWSKGMTMRPDLLQSRLDVEKQGIQLKFDYNQLYPEVDVVGSYGYNGTGQEYSDVFSQISDANRPFYGIGGQLTMPLSNVGPRNTYKADKVTLQQLLLKMKQFEQNVLVDIDNAVKKAQSDYQSVEASRQARIYAEAALDAEQKKYAVGKSTTFNVLGLQNTLTADRGTEIRDLANYYEDLANLAKSEGSTLERHHINVEVK